MDYLIKKVHKRESTSLLFDFLIDCATVSPMITPTYPLPPKIWSHIFSFLNRYDCDHFKPIKLVCKDWHAIFTQALYLDHKEGNTHFEINYSLKPQLKRLYFRSFDAEMVRSVLSNIDSLRELHLGYPIKDPNPKTEDCLSGFNGLPCLTYFGMSYFDPSALKKVAEIGTSLQKLSCEGSSFRGYTELNHLSTLTNLTSLTITAENSSLLNLPALLKLRTLKLTLPRRPSILDLAPLSLLTRLEKLFLNANIDGETVHNLALTLPQLKEFTFSYPGDFSNWQNREELIQVCSRFHNLRYEVAYSLLNMRFTPETRHLWEEWLRKWRWMVEGVVSSGMDLNSIDNLVYPVWFRVVISIKMLASNYGRNDLSMENYLEMLNFLMPFINVHAKDIDGRNILSYVHSLLKEYVLTPKGHKDLTEYFLAKGVMDIDLVKHEPT